MNSWIFVGSLYRIVVLVQAMIKWLHHVINIMCERWAEY